MKKMIALLILAANVSIAAPAPKNLAQFTTNAASVQAVLHEGLSRLYKADLESAFPMKLVAVDIEKRAYIVKTDAATLTCMSATGGASRRPGLTFGPAVMSYRCELKGKISDFTADSGSVQAVIYEALAEVYAMDKASPYPHNKIKVIPQGYSVADENTLLECKSTTKGMAMVQTFACEITE